MSLFDADQYKKETGFDTKDAVSWAEKMLSLQTSVEKATYLTLCLHFLNPSEIRLFFAMAESEFRRAASKAQKESGK